MGVTDEAICEALAAFKGVGRRFTQTGEFAVPAAHGGGTFTVIDDYGHHPVEMAATLAAAARPARPPHCAGVPAAPLHAHPRLLRGFRARAGNGRRRAAHRGVRRGRAAAGGRRRPSSSRALRVAGKVEPVFVEDVAELPQAVLDFVRDGDVVIVMGAGSISKVPAQVGELA